MAQHDMVIDNGPGLAVRQDMNAAVQALVSTSSGPVEPTVKFPGMLWLDTSVEPNGLLRQRTLANDNWISLTVSETSLGESIHAAPDKAVPADTDEFPMANSTSTPTPWELAKISYANLKAAVIGALGLTIHGSPAKTVLVDADEFGIADSVSTPNAWNIKRHSWANLKSMIGIGANQRLAPAVATSLGDGDLMINAGWYFMDGADLHGPLGTGNNWGYVQVFQISPTAVKQVWYSVLDHRQYTRFKHQNIASGAWQPWVETTSVNAVRKDADADILSSSFYKQAGAATEPAFTTSYTPDWNGGVANMRAINPAVGTAYTFNAPATTVEAFTMVVLIWNPGVVGACTFAGFTKVSGDAVPTAAGPAAFCYITCIAGYKSVFVEALQ